MTAQEIIEKIRAEVNRMKPRIRKICGEEVKIPVEKVRKKFDTLLSILSDLEKKCEKPTNHKDIDTEIGHWLSRLDDKYCILVNDYSIQDIKDTARYFAKWGTEHLRDTTKETDVLEKVKDLTHEVRVAYERGIEVGRKEQKEQMMKEAVEVWLAKDKDEILSLFQYEPTADNNGWLRGGRKLEIYDFFNYEDFYHLQDKMGVYDSMKVKLIIIKEEGK